MADEVQTTSDNLGGRNTGSRGIDDGTSGSSIPDPYASSRSITTAKSGGLGGRGVTTTIETSSRGLGGVVSSGVALGRSLVGRTVDLLSGNTTPQTITKTDNNPSVPMYFADILQGDTGQRGFDTPIAIVEGSGSSSISPTLIILVLVGVGVAIYYFNRKGA